MATDLRSVIAEVVATGKAREVPDEGVVVLPLDEWRRIRRVAAMQAAAAMGRRLQLDDGGVADLIRDQRELRTQQILGDGDRR